MGKPKRFNSYDLTVKQKRLEVQSYGAQRQRLSINSSFRGPPLEPPIATVLSSDDATGTGTFCSASLAADQTTNIAATNHIEFDTLDEDGGITLQTGAGQLDGIFELGAGKKYYLTGAVRPEFSGATGQLVMAWYDITNTAELGKRAIYESQTHASNNADQPKAEIVITPTTNITIEFRIIAVTALTALATEYSQVTIFEIALGGSSGSGSGGGGSGVSFPITPTINDHGNVGTTTEDLDLSAATGHVHKITLTGDPTLTFSNPPSSGTQQEFEIEFVQDATGGREVTWPASVAETVTISKVASATTIVTVRVNDGGTTYHAIPALRGSISLSAGSVYANVALSNLVSPTLTTDLNFNTQDITNMDRIQFVSSSGVLSANSTPTIFLDSSSIMTFNVASTKSFQFLVNGSATVPFTIFATSMTSMSINPLNSSQVLGTSGASQWGDVATDELSLQAVTAPGAPVNGDMWLDTSDSKIYARSAGSTVEVGAGANTTLSNLGTTALNTDIHMGSFDIDGLDRLIFTISSGSLGSAGDPAIYLGSTGNMIYNIATGDTFAWTIQGITVGQFSQTGGSSDSLFVVRTVDDATPIIRMLRVDSTPTGGTSVGSLEWNGVDSSGTTEENYASISVDMEDLTIGAVDGSMHLNAVLASLPVAFMSLNNSNDGKISAWKNIQMQTGIDLELNSNDLFFDGTDKMYHNGTTAINVDVDGATQAQFLAGGILLPAGKSFAGEFHRHTTTASVSTTNGDVWYSTGDAAFKFRQAGTTTEAAMVDVINTFSADNTFQEDVTFGTANSDIVTFKSTVAGDSDKILISGGDVIKSSSSVEIGFQVGNGTLTVGTLGSIVLPVTTGISSKSDADTKFGNLPGAMGLADPGSSSVTMWFRQSNGNWASVALTRDAAV